MSIYSELSKKIGWDRDTKVSIPSTEEAKELHNDVLVNQSIDAFETVFRIHRFAPTADGGEDAVAMGYIHDAYTQGQIFFK
ncbi:hypothetical protein [Sphingobacterium hotanense]|uniref:Uncharacterized protein n=1 Tax=Sphingobacterium hotanense TaxID=649196 RepID=A0ABT7NLM1_9SPHI|nr:hypothetical protein [Sphingobacterium hotanense]MDM1048035.1 hypothetical protein [Sphingobacterium hotanense]